MATPLTVSTGRRDDGSPVLTAVGELHLSNIEVFDSAVTEALEDGARLTVDLSAVEYLDSGAINALFSHAERIHVLVNPILMPVLKVSGFTEVASVEAAPPAVDL